MREIRGGSVFDSEQSMCDQVREFDKTMGKVTNAIDLTQEGHTTNILHSSQVEH